MLILFVIASKQEVVNPAAHQAAQNGRKDVNGEPTRAIGGKGNGAPACQTGKKARPEISRGIETGHRKRSQKGNEEGDGQANGGGGENLRMVFVMGIGHAKDNEQ